MAATVAQTLAPAGRRQGPDGHPALAGFGFTVAAVDRGGVKHVPLAGRAAQLRAPLAPGLIGCPGALGVLIQAARRLRRGRVALLRAELERELVEVGVLLAELAAEPAAGARIHALLPAHGEERRRPVDG